MADLLINIQCIQKKHPQLVPTNPKHLFLMKNLKMFDIALLIGGDDISTTLS